MYSCESCLMLMLILFYLEWFNLSQSTAVVQFYFICSTALQETSILSSDLSKDALAPFILYRMSFLGSPSCYPVFCRDMPSFLLSLTFFSAVLNDIHLPVSTIKVSVFLIVCSVPFVCWLYLIPYMFCPVRVWLMCGRAVRFVRIIQIS